MTSTRNDILLILGKMGKPNRVESNKLPDLNDASQNLHLQCTERGWLIASSLSCGRIWITYHNVLYSITIPDFSPSSFPVLCWCLRMSASCLVLVSSIEAWGYTCRGKSFTEGGNKYHFPWLSESGGGELLHSVEMRRETEWSSHFLWAVLWSLHPVAGLQQVKEAFRSDTWVWISSQCHYLPQQHTKGPAGKNTQKFRSSEAH